MKGGREREKRLKRETKKEKRRDVLYLIAKRAKAK